MSTHILQQFDEQWLEEIALSEAMLVDNSLRRNSASQRETTKRSLITLEAPRQWIVVCAALLIAAFALLVAYDAGRRADQLQRQLIMHEWATRK